MLVIVRFGVGMAYSKFNVLNNRLRHSPEHTFTFPI